MITTTNDRHLYIGGSEANFMYLNYESSTFKKWWSKKLVGVSDEKWTNNHMDVGTILEDDIIDLYESFHGVWGVRGDKKVKGIARANTDYIRGDKVYDVKATSKALEWYLKNQVPIAYRRQLLHYCYVYEFDKAAIIAYQVDEDTLDNPFTELQVSNLHEIEVEIKDSDLIKHKQKLDYLEHCKELQIFPVEGGI